VYSLEHFLNKLFKVKSELGKHEVWKLLKNKRIKWQDL